MWCTIGHCLRTESCLNEGSRGVAPSCIVSPTYHTGSTTAHFLDWKLKIWGSIAMHTLDQKPRLSFVFIRTQDNNYYYYQLANENSMISVAGDQGHLETLPPMPIVCRTTYNKQSCLQALRSIIPRMKTQCLQEYYSKL